MEDRNMFSFSRLISLLLILMIFLSTLPITIIKAIAENSPSDEVFGAYEDFIRTKKYEQDVWGGEYSWEYDIDRYAVLDIDGDGIPELIIDGTQEDIEFSMSWVYSYNSTQKKVIYLSTFYRFRNLGYSQKYKALALMYSRSNLYSRSTCFLSVDGTELFELTKEDSKELS